MRQKLLLFTVLLGAAISLTAIDKYDERTCVTSRSPSVEINYASSGNGYRSGSSYARPGSRSLRVKPCDGFLPW